MRETHWMSQVCSWRVWRSWMTWIKSVVTWRPRWVWANTRSDCINLSSLFQKWRQLSMTLTGTIMSCKRQMLRRERNQRWCSLGATLIDLEPVWKARITRPLNSQILGLSMKHSINSKTNREVMYHTLSHRMQRKTYKKVAVSPWVKQMQIRSGCNTINHMLLMMVSTKKI